MQIGGINKYVLKVEAVIGYIYVFIYLFIRSFILQSYDRYKAPSKTTTPQSAIHRFLFQFPVSSYSFKVIQ